MVQKANFYLKSMDVEENVSHFHNIFQYYFPSSHLVCIGRNYCHAFWCQGPASSFVWAEFIVISGFQHQTGWSLLLSKNIVSVLLTDTSPNISLSSLIVFLVLQRNENISCLKHLFFAIFALTVQLIYLWKFLLSFVCAIWTLVHPLPLAKVVWCLCEYVFLEQEWPCSLKCLLPNALRFKTFVVHVLLAGPTYWPQLTCVPPFMCGLPLHSLFPLWNQMVPDFWTLNWVLFFSFLNVLNLISGLPLASAHVPNLQKNFLET